HTLSRGVTGGEGALLQRTVGLRCAASPLYETDIRKVSETPVVLQAVAGKSAVRDGEGAEVRLHVDRAGVGAVEQGHEAERGRSVLAQLAEQVVLDDAGVDDVLEHVDVPAPDVGEAEEVDLQRVRGAVPFGVADDVDEAIADVAGDGPEQIGQEDRPAFEDAEEEDLRVAGIAANVGG